MAAYVGYDLSFPIGQRTKRYAFVFRGQLIQLPSMIAFSVTVVSKEKYMASGSGSKKHLCVVSASGDQSGTTGTGLGYLDGVSNGKPQYPKTANYTYTIGSDEVPESIRVVGRQNWINGGDSVFASCKFKVTVNLKSGGSKVIVDSTDTSQFPKAKTNKYSSENHNSDRKRLDGVFDIPLTGELTQSEIDNIKSFSMYAYGSTDTSNKALEGKNISEDGVYSTKTSRDCHSGATIVLYGKNVSYSWKTY